MAGDGDDAQLVAALQSATDDDRERLRSALRAVREATPPLFEWHGGTPDADGVIQMPYPEYHPVISEFLSALSKAHAVADVDWMHWSGASRYSTDADVRIAPVADAVRLITTVVRGERFDEGTVAAALEDGRLQAAAERILDAW